MQSSRQGLLRSIILLVFVVFVFGLFASAQGFETLTGNYEYTRARILSYVLKQNLEKYHYSHKEINDTFSKDAFDVYIKRLDPQKRFLLKDDVRELTSYASLIDDELNSARLKLPETAEKILNVRVEQVSKMVKDLLAEDFDFSVNESVETDSEKLDYCASLKDLRERWRKSLKYFVLNEYLQKIEDSKKKNDVDKPRSGEDSGNPAVDVETIKEKLLKNYEITFSRMLEDRERDWYNQYFSSIAAAFDPHTDYMPPTDKEDFDIHMRGSLEGIGAVLREEDGYVKVVRIIPGGPADRQGDLDASDIILKVGEKDGEPVDITYMRLRDAVNLIRGRKGTEVSLTVEKADGTRLVIPIVRDVVQLEESFVKSTTLLSEDTGRKYGYIKIPNFYRDFEKTSNGGNGRNSTEDVKKAIQDLTSHDVSGIMIDLRNNGGGALTDAVMTTGLFIESGPIVQVKDSEGNIQVLSDDDDKVYYSGPIIVLVNKMSASASEILAAALQDYRRAIIIGGEHTHGKGTVQSIIDLDNKIPLLKMSSYKPLGALRVTTQKFYRISGESTQFRGILPDIVLPDRFEPLKSGEQYLEHALPWDTVKSAEFKAWRTTIDSLDELRKMSRGRISANRDFVDIESDVRKTTMRQEKTTQPLHIEEARKKREEAKRISSERKKINMHGTDVLSDDEDGNSRLSREEREKRWLKTVQEDIYVLEAMAVLNDIVRNEKNVTMK